VIDATDENFATVAIDRSNEVAVVVDLWAEWCGPCKTLGPLLEKVVSETNGKVELVKVDVDANPRVAETFRVQSIPAVFALKDGAIVDGFVGAVPEREIRDFIERLAPGATEVDQLAEQGDETSLREALDKDPTNPDVAAQLGQLLVDSGRYDEALSLLTPLPTTLPVKTVLARAKLAQSGVNLTGDVELTLEHLLSQAKTDPSARANLLEVLDALGPDDPRYVAYRRRLASLLY
jgi:putative thioredoxin